MAVYNGEEFIKEQIDSIIKMMSVEDELVISYDVSTDSSLEIIKQYVEKDSRIRIVYDSGHSVESNFNNAVKNCEGKYIFLSDQDDVWINDKINKMCEYFENHSDTSVLISDGYMTDCNLNVLHEIFDILHTTTNPFYNYVKGTFLGCQMAFCSNLKEKIWPVPEKYHIAHDLWLGVIGQAYGKVDLYNEKLILHRLHDGNFSNTSRMSFFYRIINRCMFFCLLVGRLIENTFKRFN